MNTDNKVTITTVILLHKQKEYRSIFQLASFSLNDFDLKKSYHEFTRRVHSEKNRNNPDATLAHYNLVDANESLQREIEIEIEIESEIKIKRNTIRVDLREEKRERL